MTSQQKLQQEEWNLMGGEYKVLKGLMDIETETTEQALFALVTNANKLHHEVKKSNNRTLGYAQQAGEFLIEAKKKLGVGLPRKLRKKYGKTKGRWSRWLDDEFDGSKETAQLYMRIARHWDDPKVLEARVNGLDIDTISKFMAFIRTEKPKETPEDKKLSEREQLIYVIKGEINRQLKDFTNDELAALEENFTMCWDALSKELAKYLLSEKDEERLVRLLRKKGTMTPEQLHKIWPKTCKTVGQASNLLCGLERKELAYCEYDWKGDTPDTYVLWAPDEKKSA